MRLWTEIMMTTKNGLFNYSNITFTADYEDVGGQYYFIINRLLMNLNRLMILKSTSIDVYYIDVCPVSNIPTLHFVSKGSISNEELDTYLDDWVKELYKLLKLTKR
jgi:hypothetical protein